MTRSSCCIALAAAIVRQAVQDYTDAYFHMMETRPNSAARNRAMCELYLIEQFFLSSWCGALTFDNGEAVLAMAKRRCKGDYT